MSQNLEQKVDAILAAVSTPPAATIDNAALTNAVNAAVTAALAPIQVQIAAIVSGVADIQSQIFEPAPAATAPLTQAAALAAPVGSVSVA